VPLVVIDGIIVNPVRRAEGETAVSAAREHDVRAGKAEWLHARQHINVVTSRSAGTVDYQKQLPQESAWIRSAKVSKI